MDSEKFAESLRAKVMAVFVAVGALLAFLGGAFPGFNEWLGLQTWMNMDVLEPLIYAISLVVSVFIAGRSYRNTKVK